MCYIFCTVNMITIIILLAILVFVLYKFSVRNFDYWKKKGVPYVEPIPFLGNFLKIFTFRITLGHLLEKFYKQFQDARYFGIWILNKPHFIIRDIELIKTILVKDFNIFSDRTVLSDVECDPLVSRFLFMVKNPEWKYIRSKMSPVFTSGKLKNMFTLIQAVSDDLLHYVEKNNDKDFIDAKELSSKYATDVIASCAFGINANCFENENAEFRALGKKIFDFSFSSSVRQILYFIAPQIVKLFKITAFHPSAETFMRKVFWDTLDEREKGTYKRNDLIDILVQMRKEDSTEGKYPFVGDRVVAQPGMFFSAGFETTSSTISFTIYELCLNPEIQTKLRSEIKNIILRQGELNYESLQEMRYMNMVVCETLRKYPVLPFLDRMCDEDYQIPDSNLIIEKGTPVYITTFGLHYDEQYFPNPEKYDPERFSEENKNKIPTYAYLPFGGGPRICVGERFAMMTVKMGLANILLEYEIERSANTPVPLRYATKSLLLASDVGLPVKFSKLISKAA